MNARFATARTLDRFFQHRPVRAPRLARFASAADPFMRRAGQATAYLNK